MNRNRYLTIAAWVLLGYAVIILQSALLSNPILPFPIVNAILLISCIAVMIDRPIEGIIWGLASMSIIDAQSVTFFGTEVIALAIALVAMVLMHEFVLKNRALHAYIVNIAIATIAYNIVFRLLINATERIQPVIIEPIILEQFGVHATAQLIVHVLLLTALFISGTLLQRQGKQWFVQIR